MVFTKHNCIDFAACRQGQKDNQGGSRDEKPSKKVKLTFYIRYT